MTWTKNSSGSNGSSARRSRRAEACKLRKGADYER